MILFLTSVFEIEYFSRHQSLHIKDSDRAREITVLPRPLKYMYVGYFRVQEEVAIPDPIA